MSNLTILHTICKFILFAFMVVGVFGLLMSISKDVHISSGKCAVDQTTNGQCPNVPEHISQWENAFIGIISNIGMLFLFISAAVLYAASKLYVNSGRYITVFHVHDEHNIPSLLQLTFAQGLAQPTL